MKNNRTWAEIDLDALKFNIEQIRKATAPTAEITAVVKSNGYGHGAVEVARVLVENGADRLAVACVSEAKQLRGAGFTQPVMILGAVSGEDASDIVKYDIIATVFSYDTAIAISNEAVKCGKCAKIHIKTDTGMSRIGYIAGENEDASLDEIAKINELEGIYIEGIFSHFATSDEADESYMRHQFDVFLSFCKKLEERGINIPIRHIANSAAVMMYPETHLEMVRAGIILYGLYPSADVDKNRLKLKPVMSMKSRITMVKEKEAGWGVSYGKDYITDKKTVIATVPVGYGDGYVRSLAEKAYVLLKDGTRAKIIGRICMDQCMIDVTNVNNISVGDEVTLFGKENVTADDIAKWMDSINYEVVCLISARIPRLYIEDGKVKLVKDYIDELI